MSNGTSFKCKTETETFCVFCHLSNPSYSPKLCKIGIVAIQSICQMSTHLLLSCLILVHNLCLRCLEPGFEFEYLLAVFSSLIFWICIRICLCSCIRICLCTCIWICVCVCICIFTGIWIETFACRVSFFETFPSWVFSFDILNSTFLPAGK